MFEEVTTQLDLIDQLQNELAKIEDRRGRLIAIENDAHQLQADVSQFVDEFAKPLAEDSFEKQIDVLKTELYRAQKEAEQRAKLSEDLDQEEQELEEAEDRLAELRAELQVLCETAECSRIEELPEAEEAFRQKVAWEERVQELKARLLELSGGETLECFLDTLQEENQDALHQRLQELRHEISQLDEERILWNQNLRSFEDEQRKQDGHSLAATQAEDVATMITALERDIQKYVTLQLSLEVLKRGIERYRQKHQGEMIGRASELFSRLTENSFAGLRVDSDDDGVPKLLGYRSVDGPGTVPVNTGMSEGTADQLFLALRLAGLEEYLKDHEPFPFIIDDILVNFDNERSLAALRNIRRIVSSDSDHLFHTSSAFGRDGQRTS